MFESIKGRTGAAKLEHPLVITGIILLSVVLSYFIAKGGLIAVMALIGLLFALIFFNRLFNHPALGIGTLLIFSFVAIGLTRYIRGVPLGLGVDGILVISYVAIYFKDFYKRINFDQANRDITYLLFIWFAYAILELFNPQALSKAAWFYAMRGVSMYQLLLIPLVFILYDNLKSLNYLHSIMLMR